MNASFLTFIQIKVENRIRNACTTTIGQKAQKSPNPCCNYGSTVGGTASNTVALQSHYDGP